MSNANSIEREFSPEKRAEREALAKAGHTRSESIWFKLLDDAGWSAFVQYQILEQILTGSEHPGRDYEGHVAELTYGSRTPTERKFEAGARQRAIHSAVSGSIGLEVAFPRRTTAWRMATVMDFTPQMIGDFGRVENKPMYFGGEKTRRKAAIADVVECADLAADALSGYDRLGA